MLAASRGFWKQKQPLFFNLNRRHTNLPIPLPWIMAAASPRVSSPPYSTASPSHAQAFKRVGTHNGSFHCDEALGCFMIRLSSKFCGADIVRTRDPQVNPISSIFYWLSSLFLVNEWETQSWRTLLLRALWRSVAVWILYRGQIIWPVNKVSSFMCLCT